jgi:hypothetical protein
VTFAQDFLNFLFGDCVPANGSLAPAAANLIE